MCVALGNVNEQISQISHKEITIHSSFEIFDEEGRHWC
ncbi:hypothetical protein D515_03352 [Grimontia indica]|uniref:Uncharacterized protein n=1 Tax=Grimontia indica TaxID=1056512 RepID=R1GNX5_9GAMM|nr:hypothetical protein D515_03352 [Grimontia indica]